MLQYRIRHLLETKGIVRPFNYLRHLGFTPDIATRLLNGKTGQLKLSQVQLLCKELVCTPNDLLQFVSQQGSVLEEGHPLLTLVRDDKPFNIVGRINKLSFEEIKEVEELITKLKSKKKE